MSIQPVTSGATTPGVPFVRLDNADPVLLEELLDVVRVVASEAAFSMGRHLDQFEVDFAEYCDVEHAIGISSGTEALALALRALGVGVGDEVVVPANSFVATAEAVSAVGATPRFVDVDPETQLLTAELLEGAIGPTVRAVIPVHLHGATVDLDPIMEIARSRRHRCRRGRLPGPRRLVPRPSGRDDRPRGLLQLPPHDEPRCLGRRRCGRDERPGARGHRSPAPVAR